MVVNEINLPDSNDINMDKEVRFTYPDGLYEAAAVLDFFPDDEAKIQFVKEFTRTLM